MREFLYKAFTPDRTVKMGTLFSIDQKSAVQELHRQDLSLISLTEKKSFSKKPFLSGPGKYALFCRQWSSLITAGIPLTETLSLMAHHMKQKDRHLLLSLQKNIQSGESLTESLEKCGSFPSLFTVMIHTGETSGTLSEQLLLLSDYYEKENQFRKKIFSSLAYPSFLLLFLLLMMIIASLLILPAFETLFQSLRIPLPYATRILLAAGVFTGTHGLHIIFLSSASAGAAAAFFMTESGKKNRDRFLFSIPLCRRILSIQFCRMLSSFLESGKPVSDSLRDMENFLPNRYLKQSISQIRKSINSGQDLSESIKNSNIHDFFLERMTALGSESGQLPFFLTQCALIMEEKTEDTLNRCKVMAEPVMILITGCLIGFFVFSVIMPVLDMTSSGFM